MLNLLGAVGRFLTQIEEYSLRDTREAAMNGDATAQYTLGTAYYGGSGVEQNDWEAAYWFQRAAEQNNARAQTSLGMMYVLGRGVPKDVIEGYKWITIAARRGFPGAQRARKTVKPRLTEEEIAAAEQAATDFKNHWEHEQEMRKQAEAELDADRKREEAQRALEAAAEADPMDAQPAMPPTAAATENATDAAATPSEPDDARGTGTPPTTAA
jgi:TPR repeat protein